MTLIVLILVFLLLSGLFSGAEIAFVSANKLEVELRKSRGKRRGRIMASFFEKPADFLSTMLVGNNIVLVIFSILSAQFLELNLPIQNELLKLTVYTLMSTIVVLIFGEFLPKTFFRIYADQALYALTYPLLFLRVLLRIPAWIMMQLSNLIIRIFVKNPVEEVTKVFTRLDLENFINKTSIEEEEINKELFENALHLREIRLKECIVPRTEVQYIDINADIEELKALFIETQLSRIMIVKNQDINEIVGYVHHQQLLKEPTEIAPLVMEVPIVPETMQAYEMMNTFIKNRTNIACVVDEFGGTSGIVTLEDILEELFGEIEDEHDEPDYYVEEQISETEFRFSGRLEIMYLNKKYEQLQFPEGDYHTLSGYIVMTREEIPQENEIFTLDNYQFVLEKVSNTKIEILRVVLLGKDKEG